MPEVKPQLKWITLAVLTVINLLNYLDRYIFSALLPAIQKDLGFTDTQLGLLGSAFVLAYLLFSPLLGFLGDRKIRTRLMGTGVAVWSVATAFSGVCTTFWGQLITRVFVGAGESAYSVIAPTVIADHFTKTSRGRTFAIFSGAIPVGSALGFILGGYLEPLLGWRQTFFVVGVPGLALAAIVFFMRDPPRGSQEGAPDIAPDKVPDIAPGKVPDIAQDKLGVPLEAPMTWKESYRALAKNRGFTYAVLGYAAYTFVIGGMAFWMPMYIVRYYNVSLSDGNKVFGIITVLGGIIGTLSGGWLADRIERHSGNGYLKVAIFSILLTVPLFFILLRTTEFVSFAAVLLVAEIALFMCISPLDVVCLSYVRPKLRATAMGVQIFVIHFLGDGISRVAMGMVSDAYGLRSAVAILPWVLVIAALLWAIGMLKYWQPVAWPAGGLRLPRFQAHRGYRPESTVIENTLDAFRRAKLAGAKMLECDVHLTADRQVVVFHDFDLRRLGGGNERVSEVSAADLKLRANAPLLSELLKDELSPELLNIELKTGEVRSRSGLEKAVVDVVRSAGAESRVMFSSFNPFALRRLARLAPDIPRALLVSDRSDKINKFYLKKMLLGVWARPHLLHLEEDMLTPERLAGFKERGVPVVAWTVNENTRSQELLERGVKSVISDRIFS